MEQNWCWTCQKMCPFADRLSGKCMSDPYDKGCIGVVYTDNKTYPTNGSMYGNSTTGTDDEQRKMNFD